MTPITEQVLKSKGFEKRVNMWKFDKLWLKLHKGQIWFAELAGDAKPKIDIKTLEEAEKYSGYKLI